MRSFIGGETPTLVVIDVQQWLADCGLIDDVVEKSAALVEKATQAGWPVAFVRIETKFRENNPVAARLLEVVQQHPDCRYTEVDKPRCGAGPEVIDGCKGVGYSTKTLIICGVWLKACVLSTVRELSWRLPDTQIIVVRDACNQEPGYDYGDFTELANGQLVNAAELG